MTVARESILIGDAERALVVEEGTFVLVDNPARIDMVLRAGWRGGCFLAAAAGIAIGWVGVREWIEVVGAARPRGSAIGASIAAVVLLAWAAVGTSILRQRKPVAMTRKLLAVLEPSTGLVRWQATGQCFPLAHVVLRIRVLPYVSLVDHEGLGRDVLAIPTLRIGPYTVPFATVTATVPFRGLVLPSVFDAIIPRLRAWGIATEIQRESIL